MADLKKYRSFLERLVRITHEEPYDREKYVELIHDISEHYRLTKGITYFYKTPLMEKRGMGLSYCDFDNGKEGEVLHNIRIVTLTKAVIIATVYGEKGDTNRSEDEIEQIDTLLRVILGFVSRYRLIKMLEEFGFYDLDGYKNFRALARYLDILNNENRLGGRIAFHIDLRNFTMVNQDIGRANGDIVLRKYYELLSETMGDDGIITRLGGDKFVGVIDRSIKRKVYDIFAGAPIAYDEAGEKKIVVVASAGVYMLPDPFMMKTYGDIMDKIMIVGENAKRQAPGGVVIYDDKMKMEKAQIKQVQTEFRIGLEKEEFAVYYQPKVDLNTRKLSGAEALCRWIKDKEVVPPMNFIPILEMNTDICDLDFYMLDHVCADIRRWLDEGREAVRVSVNFSRKHLVDIDLIDKIVRVVDKHKVPHEYIEIELTETTTDASFRDLHRVVSGLREQGIWTAVDDFGVGYSSLSLIGDIPWNVLKVDKSFVPKNNENQDSKSNKMFKHVIMLAHDIGLECVIEGVESVDQLEVLRANDCSIVQGYFFDRPLPLKDFEERLDRMIYPEI